MVRGWSGEGGPLSLFMWCCCVQQISTTMASSSCDGLLTNSTPKRCALIRGVIECIETDVFSSLCEMAQTSRCEHHTTVLHISKSCTSEQTAQRQPVENGPPGEDVEGVPGEEVEGVPGEEVEDVTGEEVEDVPGEEVEDVPGEEVEDVPGEEVEGVPGEEATKDHTTAAHHSSDSSIEAVRGRDIDDVMLRDGTVLADLHDSSGESLDEYFFTKACENTSTSRKVGGATGTTRRINRTVVMATGSANGAVCREPVPSNGIHPRTDVCHYEENLVLPRQQHSSPLWLNPGGHSPLWPSLGGHSPLRPNPGDHSPLRPSLGGHSHLRPSPGVLIPGRVMCATPHPSGNRPRVNTSHRPRVNTSLEEHFNALHLVWLHLV